MVQIKNSKWLSSASAAVPMVETRRDPPGTPVAEAGLDPLRKMESSKIHEETHLHTFREDVS